MPIMKRLSCAAVAMAVGFAPAIAQTPASPATPAAAQQQLAADPLNTNAPYAYILDGDTGTPLYCKKCHEPMVPASMSKLMLYYLVFERLKSGRLKLTDEFTVSEHAWRTGGAGTDGSTMFLQLNSKVSVENLLKGAIIQSGNDACIVLAEGISGSEEAFAREATARARELGLDNSTFANATGLDHPDHRMTAADIGRIGYLIVSQFPEFYPWFAERTFEWNGIRQPNRNPLLREVTGADGIKTGHLSVSGYGLVGSAVRDGKRRIIVMNGLASETERRQEASRVMRVAFTDFETKTLVKAGTEVATADVWLGEDASVPLVATQDVTVGMHVDAQRSTKAVVVYKGPLNAPLKQGDVVGDLVITAGGMPEIRVPVAAGASVKKLGLFGRAVVGLRGG
jgi:serine-type D-Ala-D-Ala carboxypeptidase (penicillin-binding protein 5/6)